MIRRWLSKHAYEFADNARRLPTWLHFGIIYGIFYSWHRIFFPNLIAFGLSPYKAIFTEVLIAVPLFIAFWKLVYIGLEDELSKLRNLATNSDLNPN